MSGWSPVPTPWGPWVRAALLCFEPFLAGLERQFCGLNNHRLSTPQWSTRGPSLPGTLGAMTPERALLQAQPQDRGCVGEAAACHSGGPCFLLPRAVMGLWVVTFTLTNNTFSPPWRRARRPTPVFLPGESRRQGSLVG